jgi:hypothetical protein
MSARCESTTTTTHEDTKTTLFLAAPSLEIESKKRGRRNKRKN